MNLPVSQTEMGTSHSQAGRQLSLTLASVAVILLWVVYTLIEALFQMGRLNPILTTLLEFVPGLLGIGLLLKAGLETGDCYLRTAPPSRRGLVVLLLLTPLFAPVLLTATWTGWHPAQALVLNPLGAVSQELFFRGALLPALLLLLRGRAWLAIAIHALLFGLWHTGPLVQGAPLIGVVAVMAIPVIYGLGWGWQTWRDRTLLWVILYHVLLQFIMSFFTWNR